MTKLKVISKDKNFAISSKVRLMRGLAMSIFLYEYEMWTITADIERRIQAVEMRCFRKLLGISYRDHIINEEMKNRIRNAIWPYKVNLTAEKNANLSDKGTSHDHLDWPRLSYRDQIKEGDEEADRGNDGKTTSKSGLALNGIYYYGKLRSAKSGGNWL